MELKWIESPLFRDTLSIDCVRSLHKIENKFKIMTWLRSNKMTFQWSISHKCESIYELIPWFPPVIGLNCPSYNAGRMSQCFRTAQ